MAVVEPTTLAPRLTRILHVPMAVTDSVLQTLGEMTVVTSMFLELRAVAECFHH